MSSEKVDLEQGVQTQDHERVDVTAPVGDTSAEREDELRHKSPLFRFLDKAFSNGVEARGIERVPEDERSSKHAIGLLVFWWSVNLAVSTVPVGMLAQAFFTLTLRSAVICIVVFNILGAACVGFIATLGPQTGMRTMVITRYSVGYVGASIFSIFNILTQLGFSCTAVILGGQTLTNVSNNKLPLEASVVIVGVLALVLCFFGYNAMHYWERYAWIIMFIFYCCMYGLGGKAGFRPHLQDSEQATGKAYSGSMLSFGGIIFSSAAGWAPVAADFNSRLPVNYPKWKVFTMSWFGIMIPLVFVETLGAVLMTVPEYAAAFAEGDAGGVINAVFKPWGGGGKFIMVVFSFSIISNCIPNTYSAALSIQTLMPLFQKVPRAIWTVLVFVIYTVAAIAGREHFSTVLSNFLAILGYWIAFFIVVVAEEHFIFRRFVIPGGYDLNAYHDIKRLPIGIAGIFSCAAGAGLAVVSMAQTWYIGPLAATLGEYGGDLGFEMSAITTGVLYPPLRYIEYRMTGR
ncbi:Purine-cytosine permease fcyB [Vanrija pseudolonga]|uniref:Purine-cytosine permease fcyB n=1 Tax=Vanrija pseudolonga TaxID=143232 RepID=A0AAF0YFQ1_9TREE|nr:Purine-cytosine permease fcyB [Vanrija pseudolonga]